MDFRKFYTKFTFASGVPCSLLKNVIADLEEIYIPATREDEAIGMAVGAYLAGQRSVVVMQNSGLGNSVNALSSLVLLYGMRIFFIVGWRGFSESTPQHLLAGNILSPLLKLLDLPQAGWGGEPPLPSVCAITKDG